MNSQPPLPVFSPSSLELIELDWGMNPLSSPPPHNDDSPPSTSAPISDDISSTRSTMNQVGEDESYSSTKVSPSNASDSMTTVYPWSIKGPILLLVLTLNRKSYTSSIVTLSLTHINWLFPFLLFFLFPNSVAPNWIADSLPPLKSTIISELGINNAQYGDVHRLLFISTSFPTWCWAVWSPRLLDLFRSFINQYFLSLRFRCSHRLVRCWMVVHAII